MSDSAARPFVAAQFRCNMNYSHIQISFIKSTKGKYILIANSFCYKKEKNIAEKCIWKCEL
ncbi:hypothetical protein HZS_1644 [Henneguya salminicola]|nr:hypothetical protein HZS_1644 [Henneguya salminicola]